jgi:hypothetical protein
MKTYITLILLSLVFLSSCGTAKGSLNALGSILEGVATDARNLGNLLY